MAAPAVNVSDVCRTLIDADIQALVVAIDRHVPGVGGHRGREAVDPVVPARLVGEGKALGLRQRRCRIRRMRRGRSAPSAPSASASREREYRGCGGKTFEKGSHCPASINRIDGGGRLVGKGVLMASSIGEPEAGRLLHSRSASYPGPGGCRAGRQTITAH